MADDKKKHDDDKKHEKKHAHGEGPVTDAKAHAEKTKTFAACLALQDFCAPVHARDPGGQAVRVEIVAGGIARAVVIETQRRDPSLSCSFGEMPQRAMGADRFIPERAAQGEAQGCPGRVLGPMYPPEQGPIVGPEVNGLGARHRHVGPSIFAAVSALSACTLPRKPRSGSSGTRRSRTVASVPGAR